MCGFFRLFRRIPGATHQTELDRLEALDLLHAEELAVVERVVRDLEEQTLLEGQLIMGVPTLVPFEQSLDLLHSRVSFSFHTCLNYLRY